MGKVNVYNKILIKNPKKIIDGMKFYMNFRLKSDLLVELKPCFIGELKFTRSADII